MSCRRLRNVIRDHVDHRSRQDGRLLPDKGIFELGRAHLDNQRPRSLHEGYESKTKPTCCHASKVFIGKFDPTDITSFSGHEDHLLQLVLTSQLDPKHNSLNSIRADRHRCTLPLEPNRQNRKLRKTTLLHVGKGGRGNWAQHVPIYHLEFLVGL